MINATGKLAVAFVVGFGAGLLTGKLYFRNAFVKQEADFEDQIQQVKASYHQNEPNCDDFIDLTLEDFEKELRDNFYKFQSEKEEARTMSIQDDEDDIEETPEEELYSEGERLSDAEKVPPRYHPYLISRAEFEEDNLHYAKESAVYYTEDHQLVSELDTELLDIEQTVGSDNVKNFGNELSMRTGEPTTIFVRNERYDTDYEIHRIDGNFNEMVLGFERE